MNNYHQQKQTSSRKTECPFSLTITESSNQWRVEIRNADHNHAPSANDMAHSVHRSQDLHQEPIMEMIETHQKTGLTAAQTLTTIRTMDSTSNLAITRRDVHNY